MIYDIKGALLKFELSTFFMSKYVNKSRRLDFDIMMYQDKFKSVGELKMENDNLIQTLIKTVEDLLHDDDITIEEIKDETGISRAYISYLKNGQKPIDALTLSTVSKFYELKVAIDNGTFITKKEKAIEQKRLKEKKHQHNVRKYKKLTEAEKQQLDDAGIHIKRYYKLRSQNMSFDEIVDYETNKRRK
ncbi:TPA_asm: helix-turn-helix domain-containing protein [Listeria monocytogenes]|nr:helix-turn-helix domain-containing protein [Listeria monocytogenes]